MNMRKRTVVNQGMIWSLSKPQLSRYMPDVLEKDTKCCGRALWGLLVFGWPCLAWLAQVPSLLQCCCPGICLEQAGFFIFSHHLLLEPHGDGYGDIFRGYIPQASIAMREWQWRVLGYITTWRSGSRTWERKFSWVALMSSEMVLLKEFHTHVIHPLYSINGRFCTFRSFWAPNVGVELYAPWDVYLNPSLK